MKVALFIDQLTEIGGAEKVALILAKHFKADIYTTYVNWKGVDEEFKNLEINEIGLFFKNLNFITDLEIVLRFLLLRVKDYDVYLILNRFCLSASVRHHPNIWIFTALFDENDLIHYYANNSEDGIERQALIEYIKTISLWKRVTNHIFFFFFRTLDKFWVKNFDKILANSKYSAKLIKDIFNRDSRILYPPIETMNYFCNEYKNFYLSVLRLCKGKGINLIISAFKEMPDNMLIIVGEGPERNRLEYEVKWFENIKFLGKIKSEKLIKLYSQCLGTIIMSPFEPFGIVPIESMAAGKPCIASNSGGFKETIIHRQTGFLIKPYKQEVKNYVKKLTPKLAKKMKESCIKRARRFDIHLFISGIKKEIDDSVNKL